MAKLKPLIAIGVSVLPADTDSGSSEAMTGTAGLGEGLGEGIGGGAITNSNAPLSQPASCGRATPRWSPLTAHWAAGMRSIAGLPGTSAWVLVDPLLWARVVSKTVLSAPA